MPTVTLQEARTSLPDLIHRLVPGEEVRIIENGRVVAVDSNATTALRPPPGLGKGFITIVSENDDHAHRLRGL